MTGDELREVMRRFPAPVAVVTGIDEREEFGLTVGSLVSVSLEPPLVCVAIGKDSARHEPMRNAGGFAASLLSAEHAQLAQHFARSGVPPVALWAGVATRPGVQGPLLEGALAWLECRTWAEYDAGDHTLFLGEVLSTELGMPGRGLVYHDSTYHPA
ncbi:MAG: flavin reductase family protein [Actinobacteria bacterium]|nr:MAG: flavin reductase family protein [Actinomycetota bacterium]